MILHSRPIESSPEKKGYRVATKHRQSGSWPLGAGINEKQICSGGPVSLKDSLASLRDGSIGSGERYNNTALAS